MVSGAHTQTRAHTQKLGISSFAEQKQSEQNLFAVFWVIFFGFRFISFFLFCVSCQLIDSFAVEIGTLKKEMVRKREPPAAREHDDTHPPFG